MKRAWLVEQIRAELEAEQAALPKLAYDDLVDGEFPDVRLQMNPTEHGIYWDLHYGDPCYDTDHTGFWGAGVITPDSDVADLADDLVWQCEDHAAQCDVALVME